MRLNQRFRPPRHLLMLFLVTTLVLALALGWLSWRLLQQDRALESQRIQERLQQVAPLTLLGLEHSNRIVQHRYWWHYTAPSAVEPIADSPHTDQVPRPRWLGFDLLSQVGDVGIHDAVSEERPPAVV